MLDTVPPSFFQTRDFPRSGWFSQASRPGSKGSQSASLAASQVARRLHFERFWNRQCLFRPSKIVDFNFVVDSHQKASQVATCRRQKVSQVATCRLRFQNFDFGTIQTLQNLKILKNVWKSIKSIKKYRKSIKTM